MPSTSASQARLMRAVAHGWKKPGGGGPSKSVAKDFVAADQGRKFKSGGFVKKKHSKPRMSPAMLAALSAPPPAAAGPPPGMGGPPPGPPMGMKKGGKVKSRGASRGDGIAQKGKTGAEEYRFAKGGVVRGGGAESKGKTKGRFV